MRWIAAIVLWLVSWPAVSQDFVPAEILEFRPVQTFTEGILGGGTEADNYQEITVRMGDRIITARTQPLGGGMIWVAQNALAFAVGRTIEGRIGRGDTLDLKVPERERPLRFKIQRAEIVR